MNAARRAVLALALGCIAFAADAQHRFTSEALVGLDQMPFVVHDLEAAEDVWRRLGFLVKPGKPQPNGIDNAFVRFEDGSGIELVSAPAAVDEPGSANRTLLDEAEGPAGFTFHARDLGALRAALQGSRFNYGNVSRTFDTRSLDYLRIVQDSRAPDDAVWLKHRNGARAMSRLWIAASRRDGRDLARLLTALKAEMTEAKVYAPDDVQATVAAVGNGEVLILPEDHQLTPGRRIIGVTFEVEDIVALRRLLASFGTPFASGGTFGASIIVAPEVTHGLWVEFRE